ncbi:hypothetical protein ACN1TK_003611 [Vibrio cholerae]
MKSKLALVIACALPFSAMANQQYGDWVFDDGLKSYVSKEIVYGMASGLIKPYENKEMQFGVYINYETCHVKEGVPEPFGAIMVVGDYHEFKVQCLGKNKAVLFPADPMVSEKILDTMITSGNVCLSDSSAKLCFSGNGVKDVVAKVKS